MRHRMRHRFFVRTPFLSPLTLQAYSLTFQGGIIVDLLTGPVIEAIRENLFYTNCQGSS